MKACRKDVGPFSDQHDLTTALPTQWQILADAGAAAVMRWTDKRLLDHCRKLTEQAGQNDLPLQVCAVIPMRSQRVVGSNMVRRHEVDHVSDFEAVPTRPYVICGLTLSWESLLRVPPYMADKILKNTNQQYGSKARGLTLAEGVCLALAYPRLLNSVSMSLIGSCVGTNHITTIRRGEDGAIVVEPLHWGETPMGQNITPCCEGVVAL